MPLQVRNRVRRQQYPHRRDMLLQEKCEITDDDTDVTMFEKLSHLGSKLIVDALDLIEEGKAKFVPQGKDYSYFPMIKKEMAKK